MLVPAKPEDIREELRLLQMKYPNAVITDIQFRYPIYDSLDVEEYPFCGPFLSSITFKHGRDTITRQY
jgi:hypothetical protein